jgi:hypothetical protein
MENKAEFDKWFKSRPPFIQAMIKQYPPDGSYRIRAGAPYAISCPGTPVTILSYNENGDVLVQILAADKLDSAREHEKMLCERYGRPQDFESITASDIKTYIDPIWLELVTD